MIYGSSEGELEQLRDGASKWSGSAWKVSKYRVFSGPYFSCIQTEYCDLPSKRFVLYPEHLSFIKNTARFLKVPIETRSTVYALISAEIQINTTLNKNRTFSH